ncbi:far upstream element-binding protein 3 isoform X1 [Lates japonicus]|uniref:Far upstream element-binding protein 3 isoform X1 n=1 Tax=Lates japonicus TaxID=270547 RepID=A0AAD3M807_LATJO|nr:far upstream element-binding protein 3 isoform X1 [Lates japonicus]
MPTGADKPLRITGDPKSAASPWSNGGSARQTRGDFRAAEQTLDQNGEAVVVPRFAVVIIGRSGDDQEDQNDAKGSGDRLSNKMMGQGPDRVAQVMGLRATATMRSTSSMNWFQALRCVVRHL